jgi:hypothetical protein
VNQPKVTPGPNEPNWWDVLESLYQLDMFADLANPVATTVEATPGLFLKAGTGNVVFEPVLALGTERTTRGGWYLPSAEGETPEKHDLWSYIHKHTAEDLKTVQTEPPPLAARSKTEFDPGDQPFGLWISNDNFDDGGIFSEPALVASVNKRLAAQPYKAMIYPLKGQSNAYLIGWEYSTNDDFQDVVCVIRNVRLKK